MANLKASYFFPLLLGLGVMGGLISCQKKQSFHKRTSKENVQLINNLNVRIEQLEKLVGKETTTLSKTDKKSPAGPIKSLTFRMGTKDDRLRIYWADGSNSDLPCTKEQSIWACG